MTGRVRCVKRGAINGVGVGELSVAARMTRLPHILGRRCHGTTVDMMRVEKRVEWNEWNGRNGSEQEDQGIAVACFYATKFFTSHLPLFCFITYPSNSYNIEMALA